MMMTQQQSLPVKKPTNCELATPKRDDDRVDASVRHTPVEPLEWRGEGVVGDNHTD